MGDGRGLSVEEGEEGFSLRDQTGSRCESPRGVGVGGVEEGWSQRARLRETLLACDERKRRRVGEAEREREQERERERERERAREREREQVEGTIAREQAREREAERKLEDLSLSRLRLEGGGEVAQDAVARRLRQEKERAVQRAALLEEEVARLRSVEAEVERLRRVEAEVVRLRSAQAEAGVQRAAGAAGAVQRGAMRDSMHDEHASLVLEEQVLQQRRDSLRILQREVDDLAASGVEERARVLRCAEQDCRRLGGLHDVMAAHQGQRHKAEVLEALLVESESRVAALELDKKEALAQAQALVEDLVDLERGVHVEADGGATGRHEAASLIPRLVGHERKIAALERQLRSVQAEHKEEIRRTRQVLPLKLETKILELEEQLARARVRERWAAEGMDAMEQAMLALQATVQALEGDAGRLQVLVASAAAEHCSLVSASALKADMVEVLRGDVGRLEAEVRAATARAEESEELAVTREAAVCSLTFEKLSLVGALDATDLRLPV